MSNVIDFEVKLFDTTALAADGSNIPRRSCEAYLQSPDYQVIIRDKVAMGGMTHKDRRLKPELKGLVGMDDQLQINNNATHYITELYFKPGDNFFYASARTFNPDLFAGDRADNITNVIGMLRTGVRMPISVVIQALWSKRGVAEKIIRIKGFDWTQNPSFKGAGDVHMFSQTIDNCPLSEDELKYYSQYTESGDYQILTKIFSSDGTVTILDNDPNTAQSDSDNIAFSDSTNNSIDYDTKWYSYYDIVSHFGQFSEEATAAAPMQDRFFSLNELAEAIAEYSTHGGKVRKVKLSNFINNIDDNITNNLPLEGSVELAKILGQTHHQHPNQELLDDQSSQKEFSTVTSIADRVIVDKLPRYSRIDRILKTYTQFWQSKKLDDGEKLRVKLLFIRDINGLIEEVVPRLEKGEKLSVLYALNRYDKKLKKLADEASDSYRRVLISQKVLKYVPKDLFGEWTVDMQNFYQGLLEYTFGEGLQEFQLNQLNFKHEIHYI